MEYRAWEDKGVSGAGVAEPLPDTEAGGRANVTREGLMQGTTDPRVGVGLGQYAERYGFEAREITVDRVGELKAAISYEGSKLRRRIYERELWWEKAAVILGGEPISLPILCREGGWACRREGLYLGGIEKRVSVWLDWGYDSRWMHDSVYVGPMPEWVQEKYQGARRLFPKGDLLVASRNEAF
ncbi:hypothetical protein LCGC14_2363310, partial [marine sediment metagenome]